MSALRRGLAWALLCGSTMGAIGFILAVAVTAK